MSKSAFEHRNAYLNEDARRFLAQFPDVNKISRLTVATNTDSSGFELMQPASTGSMLLYKKEKDQLQYYANLCALKQADWNTKAALHDRLLQRARDLISALKDEYVLK
ncbi:hypothetical protein [Flavitalea sp.]|nr:hypothetical protein [Flavitalea sp.]